MLFIVLDDLNDFPFGGHPQTVAPNLERLAAAGITFRNAQTPSPACNPARVAVLTGISPATSGVFLNSQNEFRTASPALANAVTVFQHFKQHGYAIRAAGKLFHGTKDLPDTDWDEYAPISGIDRPDPARLPLNGIGGTDPNGDRHFLADSFDWGVSENPGEADISESTWAFALADWAASHVAASHSEPTLIAIGFHGPHTPNHVPRRFYDLLPETIQLPTVLPDDLADVPEPLSNNRTHLDVLAADVWEEAVRGYLASVAFRDAAIGRVLDAWEQSDEEWIVVVWTDHGLAFGQKERWGKITLYEEATRSPLLIAGPGVTPGSRSELPASLLDLYPTLIDLAGLTPRPELEGKSLVPILQAPDSPLLDVPVVINLRGDLAWRSSRWKYIQRRNFPTDEFYDLEIDPLEWHNRTDDPQYDTIKAWLQTGGVLFECQDGVDNDGDGLADYPADPGCASADGPREGPPCAAGGDRDADGVGDACDNCGDVPNGAGPGSVSPFQVDADGDGIGNACDGDFDQDGFVGGPDFDVFLRCFDRATARGAGPAEDPTCAESDLNGDGFVGGPDFTLFLGVFGGAPGPSGRTACGLGYELLPALALLALAARRARAP